MTDDKIKELAEETLNNFWNPVWDGEPSGVIAFKENVLYHIKEALRKAMAIQIEEDAEDVTNKIDRTKLRYPGKTYDALLMDAVKIYFNEMLMEKAKQLRGEK